MRDAGRTLLNFAFLCALTIWGGMVCFFLFIATPAIFAELDRDTAARLLGTLFPRYFRLQLVCIAVALAVVGVWLARGALPRRLTRAAAVLLSGALAITLYGSVGLLPRMEQAQARVPSFVTTPRDDPARVAYGKLHGRAMVLNAVAAILGGSALALVAFEPQLLAPRGRRAAEDDRLEAPAGSDTGSEPRPARAPL